MKILFPADGSKFTKKALAFLVTHEAFTAADTDIVVLHCLPAVPLRIRAVMDEQSVNNFYEEEAKEVLAPIAKFLQRHGLRFRTRFEIGAPAQQIVRAARRDGVHLIVMGTHGRGALAATALGSVANKVVAHAEVPVLLVK